MDIQTVKGAKNIFFGGEGLFNTVVTGPGKIVVQTLPVNKLALELYRIYAAPKQRIKKYIYTAKDLFKPSLNRSFVI